MAFLEFDGSYTDEHGTEPVRWRLAGIEDFDLSTEVRSIMLVGFDFDSLEVFAPNAERAGLHLSEHPGLEGTVVDCVLRGEVPCRFVSGGDERPEVLRFSVDLMRADHDVPPVEVEVAGTVGGAGDFEDALVDLAAALPAGQRVACCFTCLLSDYHPAGHGLTWMACHRDVPEQYLAVRDKTDYLFVPVTERVPEFYWCPRYRPRVPGTGYRG